MNDIQLAHFSWGEPASRQRINDVALRDARIATEARTFGAPTTARPGLVERLGLSRVRLALAGGPVAETDPCGCAA